jgi:putative membrane protein
MTMKNSLLAGLALTLLGTAALAQAPSLPDSDFVTMAAVGNTFEIEEAKLALEKAADPKLKDFANMMIADHQEALKTLQETDAGKGAKTMLDAPHQAMLDNLKGFSGADFDKIYKADQVASHAETEALLSDYQQNGQTTGLKDWVDAVLPKVKHHRAMINAMP